LKSRSRNDKERTVAKTIVGSFDSVDDAHEAMRALQESGFPANDISIIANNVVGQYGTEGQLPDAAPATLSDTGAGAATGAAAGGLIGGAAGLVVGVMGLAIPGIGPIVAAGPLAATLAGAGAGAVAGGLIGGLTGVGVPEEEAHFYAEAVRRGSALVTVRAENARAEEAARILRSGGAVDIERRAEAWRGQGWLRHDPTAEPLSADELRRERDLYRRGAGRSAMEKLQDDGWREQVQHFRMQHIADYGASPFEEYEPAYHYGWSLGDDNRYRGRKWFEIEPEVRSDWETRYPDGAWELFKDAVKRGWERTTAAVERAIPSDPDRDGR
jgi:hypothetical protein